MKKAIVILAHGSKKEEAKNDLLQVTTALAKRTGLTTRLACMQLADPSFEQTIDNLVSDNYNEIIVIPFFLANGAHMQEDIPELIQKAKQKHSDITIKATNYLWPDSAMIDLLEKRVGEGLIPSRENADRDKTRPSVKPITSPQQIEQESFSIIDSLINRDDLDQNETQVLKRLIHTSGDTSLANLVTFTEKAVDRAIEAISQGVPIITDVSMVKAGINKQLASSLSIDIYQLIADKEVKEQAISQSKTRSQIAINKLALKYPNSIIAIGNAPTALFEAANLIDQGLINPAIVIAMPVGFVGTVQSKDAIKKTSAEYICVEGTRGGSNLAAATVNALLKLASSSSLGNEDTSISPAPLSKKSTSMSPSPQGGPCLTAGWGPG